MEKQTKYFFTGLFVFVIAIIFLWCKSCTSAVYTDVQIEQMAQHDLNKCEISNEYVTK